MSWSPSSPTRSVDPGFVLYGDEALSDPMPYGAENRYVRDHAPRIHLSYRSLLPYLRSGMRVLEIGASPFYLSYLISRYQDVEVDAVFFSKDEHALRKRDRAYFDGGVIHLFHENIEEWDGRAREASYDLVICMECLEHLDRFPFGLLESISASTRPGSVLFVTVPNVCRAANIARLVLGRNMYHPYRPDPSGRHKHEYTLGELVNVFSDCLGFEVRSARRRPTHLSPRQQMFYALTSLGGLLNRYLPQLEIICRHPEQLPSPRWDRLLSTLYREQKSTET